jgi:hypothetical protein
MTMVVKVENASALINLGMFLVVNGDLDIARHCLPAAGEEEAKDCEENEDEKKDEKKKINFGTRFLSIGEKRLSKNCSILPGVETLHPHAVVETIINDYSDVRQVRAERFIACGRPIYIAEPFAVLHNQEQPRPELFRAQVGGRDFSNWWLTFFERAAMFCENEDIFYSTQMMQCFPRSATRDQLKRWYDDTPRLVTVNIVGKTLLTLQHRLFLFRRFVYNAFPMVDMQTAALYHIGSAFNHSCVANCFVRFARDNVDRIPRMEVYAVGDIQADEEITINYLACIYDARTVARLVDRFQERRERILRHFGFLCECDFCQKQMLYEMIGAAKSKK